MDNSVSLNEFSPIIKSICIKIYAYNIYVQFRLPHPDQHSSKVFPYAVSKSNCMFTWKECRRRCYTRTQLYVFVIIKSQYEYLQTREQTKSKDRIEMST